MIAALVPVKRLDAGKSRLAATFSESARERLTLAMLGDVLDALAGVAQIDRRAVVTPDPAVGAAAEALGAEALVRDDPGLNASLDAARDQLALGGLDRLLVVLGDVAGAQASDLEALFSTLDRLGGRGAVLAAARDGGTAALLRSPPDVIPSRFGAASAAAHAAAARDADVPFEQLDLASLAIDLDQEEDVAELLLRDTGATRTRALLAELGR